MIRTWISNLFRKTKLFPEKPMADHQMYMEFAELHNTIGLRMTTLKEMLVVLMMGSIR